MEGIAIRGNAVLCWGGRADAVSCRGSRGYIDSGGHRAAHNARADVVTKPKTGAGAADTCVPSIEIGERDARRGGNTGAGVAVPDKMEGIAICVYATLDRGRCGDAIASGGDNGGGGSGSESGGGSGTPGEVDLNTIVKSYGQVAARSNLEGEGVLRIYGLVQSEINE